MSAEDPRSSCRFRIVPGIIPRRANALCIEVGAWPQPRCTLKLPAHWTGKGASALRWLGSGGSPIVFGHCSAHCPRDKTPEQIDAEKEDALRRGEY